MSTIKKLWKVVLTHKMGAQAPSYFVETEYVAVKSKTTRDNKEVEMLKALKKAKKLTRLNDFPDDWIIAVVDTEKVWNPHRNKWWTKKEELK